MHRSEKIILSEAVTEKVMFDLVLELYYSSIWRPNLIYYYKWSDQNNNRQEISHFNLF